MTTSGEKRRAVVVIHGIGEGRPMGTTRGFTSGIVSADPGVSRFVSHPDRISGSMELFTLRFPPRNAVTGDPVTDVYECYWAHRMRDTKMRDVLPWIFRLLINPPRGTRGLVRFYWFLFILALLLGAAIVIAHLPLITLAYTSVTTGVVGSLVAIVIGWLTQRYLFGYIGDAARYLTPDVGNITQRAAIRKDARDLLVKLHTSGRYDRIMIVGHSLGSVIAYDVVNRLWDEYRDLFAGGLRLHDKNKKAEKEIDRLKSRVKKSKSQLALREVEKRAFELREMTADDQRRPEKLSGFRTAQAELWSEQRRLKNAWLISDLVTLGSPLAHASWLTRVGGDDLEARFNSREFGRCPPLNNIWERAADDTDKTPEHEALAYHPRELDWIRVIIPSAVFSVVRWTNLYFPGDVIGGKVHTVFGPAVNDIAVRRNAGSLLKSWILSRSPTSHTKYWSDWEEANVQFDSDCPIAVRAIQKALYGD